MSDLVLSTLVDPQSSSSSTTEFLADYSEASSQVSKCPRAKSPEWEDPPSFQAAKGDLGGTTATGGDFIYKHPQPETETLVTRNQNQRRVTLKKQGTLDKFLSNVTMSARRNQFAQLPFHSLSVSKRFKESLDHTPNQNRPVGYFHNQFDVMERIGFGDFAEVFKARFKPDGKLYAVKRSIFRFGSCITEREPSEGQLRWMDEAFYHSSVSGHPNIVECVQAWEEAGYFHIQMEYLPLRLDEFAEKTYPLSQTMLWSILTDMLMAVDHLHKMGYCHLDIKPENIFLDEFGVTKLGDFGLITMPEASGKEAGDARYMPFESCDATKLGFAVDIFSLGITMLELCTDVRLESHGSQWRLLREIQWPATFYQRIPVAMQPILRQMMSIDPRLRPSAAGLLNLSPIRQWAMRRHAFFLAVPLRRVQKAVANLVRSSWYRSVDWVKSWRWVSSTVPSERPVTPLGNISAFEHSLRYSFLPETEEKGRKTADYGMKNLSFAARLTPDLPEECMELQLDNQPAKISYDDEDLEPVDSLYSFQSAMDSLEMSDDELFHVRKEIPFSNATNQQITVETKHLDGSEVDLNKIHYFEPAELDLEEDEKEQ